MAHGRAVTASELNTVLVKAGVNSRGFIVDSDYQLPSRAWLSGLFSKALQENLKKIGASEYVAEKNDCDDFSLAAAFFARQCQNLTSDSESSLAVGIVFYSIGGKRGNEHAINFAVVKEGAYKLIFFEPQTGTVVPLTEDEVATIFFYYV